MGSIAGLSAKKPNSRIGKLPIDTVLLIKADQALTDSRWHHAGNTIVIGQSNPSNIIQRTLFHRSLAMSSHSEWLKPPSLVEANLYGFEVINAERNEKCKISGMLIVKSNV